ncbi:MAG: hypothetical protein D6791_11050 [Chloroflexi bacterium]|nr:MAG: hypothetical protein D6791_11050 [Chloroflexota bacterium]
MLINRIKERNTPVIWLLSGAVAGALVALVVWLQQMVLRPRVEQQVVNVRHRAEELRAMAEPELQHRRQDIEALLHRARRELNELYGQAEHLIEDARLRSQIARKKAEIKRLEAQRLLRRVA